jgi:uncharacterized membrane protein YadS
MNGFIFALIVSAVVTVCLLVTKSNENNETNNSYVMKVFIVTFFVVFVCHSYLLGGEGAFAQEIDVGEPPF